MPETAVAAHPSAHTATRSAAHPAARPAAARAPRLRKAATAARTAPAPSVARLPSATPALAPAPQAHENHAAPASETPSSGRQAHTPVSLPTSLRPMLATWQGLTLPLVAGWDTWRSTTGPAAMPHPQGLRLQQERAEAVTADWVLRLQAWQDPALLMPLGLRPRLSQSPESGALREVPQERDPLMPGRIQPEIRFGIQLRF